jgi:hypothetical protein
MATDTSIDAYINLLESGGRTKIRGSVLRRINEHGPLPDFRLDQLIAGPGIRSIGTRRYELCLEDIVGLMPERVVNPETKQRCMVWGLVGRDDAEIYRQPDVVVLRINGKCYRKLIPFGDIYTLSDAEIVEIVRSLLAQSLKSKPKRKRKTAPAPEPEPADVL